MLRVKRLIFLTLLVSLVLWTMVPAAAAPQQPTGIGQGNPMPAPPPPMSEPNASSGQAQPPATPPNQPGDTVQVPRGQAPDQESNGVFVFRKQVEEVTLHATVVDDHQQLITNLDRNAFVVFEDGQPQKITSFHKGDVPVALGILVDNSGSMHDKRPAVNQAALNLVKASNPQDKVFVVNFNQTPYLDQDYTDDISLLKNALEHIEARGGTALYDAVVASADHLMKTAPPDQKKVLLVVTDGEDTASLDTLEQVVKKVAVDGGPTIYTIGILGGERQKRARRALSTLAEQTGGVAFFPKNLEEVDSISQQVAHDIRNQYIIGYKPTTPRSKGGYRTVRVEAKSAGHKRLQVRTRSGYFAAQGRVAAR
jgi:Ca-activated chloride channel family protein